jgi:hypothetical protein
VSPGRPSEFSDELGVAICARIAEGDSLVKICKGEGMPSVTSVYRWLADDRYAGFRELYTRAREDQADTLADQIVDIADDGLNDTYEADDGTRRTDTDVIQRSKLRVDARKWVAAKLKPRKYGDRVAHEHSGKIGLESLVADEPASE